MFLGHSATGLRLISCAYAWLFSALLRRVKPYRLTQLTRLTALPPSGVISVRVVRIAFHTAIEQHREDVLPYLPDTLWNSLKLVYNVTYVVIGKLLQGAYHKRFELILVAYTHGLA
jgi:hypothetical protein